MDDPAVKKWLWDLALSTPDPVGYNPALDFITYDNSTYGVLRLTPWRVEVYTLGVVTKIWKASGNSR